MSDYNGGGKVYVVEDVLERSHLDGGPITEAEANALAKRVITDLAPEWPSPTYTTVTFIASERRADAYRLSGNWRGYTSYGTAHMLVNDYSFVPNTLTVLHELAHVLVFQSDRHGRAWQEQAATLYGRYLSPRAEREFRNLMDLPAGATRRRRARASLRPAWTGRAR